MCRLTLLLVFLWVPSTAHGCTAIALGREATADGSTIATFNADSSQLDSRMVYIPAQDHAPGALRPVYASDGNYPRYVGVRSKSYDATAVNGVLPKQSKAIGHIPEVSHTYGYWEACYPIMNEKGLGFGESTTYGQITTKGQGAGGTALFYVDSLMAIALERCETARCAVETMGHWGETEGFYGEDSSPSAAGEALTVVDGHEAWIFHILADFDGGAVWAAQRVPDGHAAVVANNFIIRNIDFNDHGHENFMWSKNILNVAQQLVSQGAPAFCSEAATFDFLKCFGADLRSDAYYPGYGPTMPDPWYTTLRMWRVQNLLAPSLGYEVTDNAFDLPFSFPVDKPVSLLEIMDVKRDQYAGTPYDLGKGALAGPFGDPNRDEGGDSLLKVPGYWPRAISLLRTSYSLVCQSKRGGSDVAWVATHQPATSVFVPFFAKSNACHTSYARGYQGEYDSLSAWWIFSFVSNWMRLEWKSMHESFVSPSLRRLQVLAIEAVRAADDESSLPVQLQPRNFTSLQTSVQGLVIEEWTRLGTLLITAHNNGYLNYPTIGTQHGYPEAWLRSIGFRETLQPLLVQPLSNGEDLSVASTSGTLSMAPTSGHAGTLEAALGGFVAGGLVVASAFTVFLRVHRRRGVADSNYCQLSGA